MSGNIEIEIAFALSDNQTLRTMSLPENASVADAIEQSAILDGFSEHDRRALSFGIWGRVITTEHKLCHGDRVEVYRPLQIDPRDARRELAQVGQTMSHTRRD